ncbi:RNA polymerase III subunit RPC82 helix-turn-helix domain-containing protein [Phlyctochytrium arcticum]|nr:RNA polymerase III subunit RPC82 helix-turn-helix domain-containing protein [Phlyctochytrium arcticum]
MSHSQYRLCSLIVKEHFGPIVESVCTFLIQHGRSPIPVISRSIELSPRQIRESLFILIHHGLVTYAEIPEGTRMAVYYKASPEEIALRDCFPLYMAEINARYGEECESILREILRQGRSSFNELLETRATRLSRDQLTEGLHRLIDNKVLAECTPEDSMTADDIRMQEEAAEVAKRGGLPLTATELTKLRKQLAAKRDAEYEEPAEGTKKRKVVRDLDDIAANKKFASDDRVGSRGGGSNTALGAFGGGDLFYRVNYERIHIFIRSADIQRLAEYRINAGAGEVIGRLLEAAEPKIQRCQGAEKGPMVSQLMLSSLIDHSVPMEVEGRTSNAVVDYLDALTQDDMKLISKASEGGGGQYVVNLHMAVNSLRGRMMESIVQEQFGDSARRIWRILNLMEKLTETQIAKLALVPLKEARHVLYLMLNAGLAFIQDVPKTLDHSAARTFFLWYVSIPQTAVLLTEDAYKTLANVKQRREKEIAARARLIEKTQRLDVVAGQAKLSEGELRAVEHLNSVVRQLLVTECRMAHLLMTMKDY